MIWRCKRVTQTSAPQLSSNERRVLDVIWREGPIARQDIARLTGLTAASITRLTKQLDDEGLLATSLEKTGSRGNQRQPISINADGALSFGVSFSHTFVDVGLMNLGGELLQTIRSPLSKPTVENVASAAKAGVAKLLSSSRRDRNKIIGIGFALPGDFASEPPYLQAHAYFPALRGVDILKSLEPHFEFPCFVENDCNTAAFGERVLGFGKLYSTFLSVFVGHGIGSGLIIDGNLLRGVHGNAGAIGYMYPMDQPRPSGQDLFETAQKNGVAAQDFSDFEKLPFEKNPPITKWCERAGSQLCEGLSIAARLFDPEAIIIGGRLPPPYLDALVRWIDVDAFCAAGAPLRKPVIRASDLGARAGVIGAAALPIYHTYLRSDMTLASDNYVNGRR
ncbi:ROK family transcriptional regulator [Hyphomonas pacifica]|nr:ROK family transcriptional regulator [Hyphomonas pacifica]